MPLIFERLEERIFGKRFPLLLNVGMKKPATSRRRLQIRFHPLKVVTQKGSITKVQHRPLESRNRFVVHIFARSSLRQLCAKGGIGQAILDIRRGLGFSHPIDVDIQLVEIQPTTRRIGTDVIGPGVLQCVQGVQPDDTDAQLCARPLDEPGQVAKISDPPVLFTAQRVQLQGEPPGPAAGMKRFRDIAARRGHDQTELKFNRRGHALHPDLHIVISNRQIQRQRERQPHIATILDQTLLMNRKTRPLFPLAVFFAAFAGHHPMHVKLPIIRGLTAHVQRPVTGGLASSDHTDRVAALHPRPLIPCGEFFNQRGTIGHAKPHGRENGPTSVIGRHMAGPGNVVVVCGDTGTVGETIQEFSFRQVVHVGECAGRPSVSQAILLFP